MPSRTQSSRRPVSLTPTPRSAPWDRSIPPSLRPLVRAYLLGYGFTVGPRVVALLSNRVSKLVRGRSETANKRPQLPLLAALTKILKAGLECHRFATFCAALIGGSTLLQPAAEKVVVGILGNISLLTRARLARWLSSAIAAYFSIQLLQRPYVARVDITATINQDDNPISGKTALAPAAPTTPLLAGRTLDLTLFAATRAVDVLVGELWARRHSYLPSTPRASTARTLDRITSSLADPFVFALTSGVVMWNWFYAPHALPHSYNTWISSAARLDTRLKTALERCHFGLIRYGVDTGQAALLQPMCEDYGFPLAWGDPTISIPYPCELVHMGCSPSCEYHALSRFCRSWLWSLKMYLPLQLALLLPRAASSTDRKRLLLRTLLSASRSSAFLGAFITLFYYGVCLARTRVGPRILGTSTATRQRIDGNIAVATGCVLSGWSVLLESPSRRQDLALFVAPRAVATLLPRQYPAEKQWIERAVFAASTAVVFTCVLENKSRVRGIVGSVLKLILAA